MTPTERSMLVETASGLLQILQTGTTEPLLAGRLKRLLDQLESEQ